MIRRKLTVYTCMMIAGISAGYFFTERVRLISAAGFLIASAIAVFMFYEMDKREHISCFAALIIGFLMFSSSFVHYESAIGSYPSEEAVYKWKGRIISAEDKGDYLRFTIRIDKVEKGRNYRVIADYKNYSETEYNQANDNLAQYIGAKVVISGQISEFSEADNPGCFDYRSYMRSKGLAYRIKVNYMETRLSNDTIWRFRRSIIGARERFLSFFDEESRSFLKGLVFGDKSEIDEEVLKEFQLNSTGHILAVSGLHIGFLHSLLRLLSSRRKTLPASILIISVMLIYGEMTMWSSSVIRAVTVLSLSILSVNLKRPFDLLTSISAAACLILMIRPYMLFNSGFQLSFAAMTSIAFFSEKLSRYIGRLLGVTISVQMGTIPVLATTFHRLNLIAFLINIPIIALSSFLVPICLFSLFLSMGIGIMPAFIVSFIELCVYALVFLNHKLSLDGYFSELISGPGTAWTLTFVFLLLILASEWFKVKRLRAEWSLLKKTALLITIPMIFAHTALYDSFRNDEIVFVSVGQGDCTHIRVGDKDILIDGGGSDFFNTGERTLMPYLMYEGVRNIDIALVTHLHKDHYLGISELSRIYPVSAVGIPSDYRDSFESEANSKDSENSISFDTKRILYLDSRTGINVKDDIYIEVLWPLAGTGERISIDDPNEHNMVYMVHYNSCKVMVTGDLLEEDELKMVEHYKDSDKLKCDILKVAHHGSKSSSSEAFLDAASPGIAVIQAGKNNMYGHPHNQTIERLESRGIKIYRTDISGAVGIDIEKERIEAHCMKY